MDLIPVLRALARRRLLLAIGIVLAALVGLLLAFHVSLSPFTLTSRRTVSILASASVLVDPPRIVPVDRGSELTSTLPQRAGLLANLLLTDSSRARIAQILGAHPDEVAVFGPATADPYVAVPTAARASEAATATREPYVLTLSAGEKVPIIMLRAAALDRARATALINAAVETLQRVSSEGTEPERAVRLIPLGLPRVTEAADSRYIGVAVAGVVLVLGLWIAALGVLERVARTSAVRRRARRLTG